MALPAVCWKKRYVEHFIAEVPYRICLQILVAQ